MVWFAGPRRGSNKKAAGGDLRLGLHWFVLMQPITQVCRAKIKPAPKTDAAWTARIHGRNATKPHSSVKAAYCPKSNARSPVGDTLYFLRIENYTGPGTRQAECRRPAAFTGSRP